MKKITFIFLLTITIQFSYSQELDTKTINIMKVKMVGAKDLYSTNDYYEALKKIREIEELAGNNKSATLQNLKVKCLIGQGNFSEAKEELDVLYELNPKTEILRDISSYSDKINTGIQDEIDRKEQERMAEIDRVENERLAVIKNNENLKVEKEKERLKRVKYFNEYVSGNETYYVPINHRNCKVIDYNGYEQDKHPVSFFPFSRAKALNGNNNIDVIPYYQFDETTLDNQHKSNKRYTFYSDMRKEIFRGFIDKNGNIVLGPFNNYTWYFGHFSEGLARACKNNSCGFIDITGKIIIPLDYIFPGGSSFHEGLAAVSLGSKVGVGYINKKGEVVIDFKYEYGKPFYNGIAGVRFKDNSGCGFINTKGDLLFDKKFSNIYNQFYEEPIGTATVSVKRKKAYKINMKGEKVKN